MIWLRRYAASRCLSRVARPMLPDVTVAKALIANAVLRAFFDSRDYDFGQALYDETAGIPSVVTSRIADDFT